MDELVKEHVWARQTTGKLVAAMGRYSTGDAGAVKDAAGLIRELVQFYPVHIVKEDRGFFVPVMKYFSATEQALMLEEFREFDRKLVHEKYGDLVRQLQDMIRS